MVTVSELLPEDIPKPAVEVNQSETDSPVVAETLTPSDTSFLPAIYMLLLLNDKSAEGAYYYINNHLGAPQVITDDSGAVVWKAEYLPFGKVNISVAQIENNLRFPGQYFDAETGLHYNWNRYYNPETGRYIAADPIGLGGGINLYAYVGGDPIGRIDPTGEMEVIGITFGYGELFYHKLKGDKDWIINDYFNHCMMSCSGNSTKIPWMNLGKYVSGTNIAGAALELGQTVKDRNNGMSWGDAWGKNWGRDMPSNMAGAECAENECESCYECCSKYAKKREQAEGK